LGHCHLWDVLKESLKKQIADLKLDLNQTKFELEKCSEELSAIRNTAENRFVRARKLLSRGLLEDAAREFQGIVENFEGTNDAKIASKELVKLDATIRQKRIEAERKIALGFKVLKPTTSVKYGDLSLRFDKLWTGKRWTFDDYGHQYFLRDAKRGNSHVLARVSITSEGNNPELPPILIYQMENGVLNKLGVLAYEFRRWKDYGSYLGNYTDYGNDFSHSKTIPFNCGLELSNEELKGKSIYVVLKKDGCFNRVENRFGQPVVEYSKGSCESKQTLKVEDFDSDYVLLKRL